jgi:hypothetical protein
VKGFKLDSNNDVEIRNNHVQMIEGDELTAQTVQCVLSTNKGEWFLNPEEGINFRAILGKHTVKKESSTTDIKRYYEEEISYYRTRDTESSESAEKLKRRLEGDI